MAFQQVTVENRVSEFPNRRTLTKEDNTTEIVTVTRNEGNVSTEGTAWGAAYANDLESRINTETNLLETNFGHVETNTTASKSYSVGETLVLNGQMYKVTAAIAQGATLTVGTNIAVHSVSAINSNMGLIRTYVSSDGLLHFINSAGADSVLPFSPNKNGPCAYIHTRASTEQDTVSFTTASAGTVYYRYVGESAGGAYTTIAKNGTAVKTGTQGTTSYDEDSGSFAVVKGDTVSATGKIGASSGGSYTYFLILRCVYN